jgi:hypothetical protein
MPANSQFSISTTKVSTISMELPEKSSFSSAGCGSELRGYSLLLMLTQLVKSIGVTGLIIINFTRLGRLLKR